MRKDILVWIGLYGYTILYFTLAVLMFWDITWLDCILFAILSWTELIVSSRGESLLSLMCNENITIEGKWYHYLLSFFVVCDLKEEEKNKYNIKLRFGI